MIKCIDNDRMTCIGANGKPKSAWKTSDEAISNATYINNRYMLNSEYKLVAYKCSHCNMYHLTKHKKRVRNF